MLLSQVNIPGTHDSATSKCPPLIEFSARTQSLTIGDQLRAGIRFFDMRVKYNSKGELVMFHGVNLDIKFA